MANPNETLPEGTDSIVTGAGTSNEDSLIMSETSNEDSISGKRSGSSTGTTRGGSFDVETDVTAAGAGSGDTTGSIGSGTRARAVDTLRSGSEKLSGQAADKARGLVSQGLERGGEALANVSRLIGDTAAGLDERLGSQYGDYARKAATTIEETANRLASKDADELIEDTRGFVRKSPGVALAGAAVLGFALVRLVKSGLDQTTNDRSGSTNGNRSNTNRTSGPNAN